MAAFRLSYLTSFRRAHSERTQTKLIEKTFTLKWLWNAGDLYNCGISSVLLLFDARAPKEYKQK